MPKLKRTYILLQEVDLRMRITDLQNLYREKQILLQRLRTPRKKKFKPGGSGKATNNNKLRGPGRPKKKTFPNPRAKMGRPRKHISPPSSITATTMAATTTVPSSGIVTATAANEEDEEEEEEEEEQQVGAETTASVCGSLDSDEVKPPRLELQASSDATGTAEDVGEDDDDRHMSSSTASGAELIRPPRLTAAATSSSPEATDAALSTSLSTLTSKFMKGKANPFANLLSQLAASGGPGPTEAGGEELPEDDEDAEEEEEEEEEEDGHGGMEESGEESSEASTANTGAGGGGGGAESSGSPSGFKFGKTSKLSYCLEAYRHSKKRKAERPKKNSGELAHCLEGEFTSTCMMTVVYI
jgi:ribosomal protein L12E/L44/L45/RPP1/RPP2